uniref:Capsid protein n=1 Tax=Riboviria sp. TaxID=2585031 RepID=A0A6M9Z7H4_9VIRU|nr:MAG: hypothetical protein [Riboviria sp.]
MNIADQRITKVEDSYIAPPQLSILSTQDRIAMPSDKLTSEDILKNPVIANTIPWSTSQAVGTTLTSFSIPAIFATLGTFHKQMLQTYAFMKPVVSVRVQVNSTKFHLGKLLVISDPMQALTPTDSPTVARCLNIYSASGQPHAIIDAGYSNSVEIKVPFEHVLTYLTTNSEEVGPQMSTIYLLILNQLSIPEGSSQTVDVNILVSCDEINLHIPMVPHSPRLVTFNSLEEYQSTFDAVQESTGLIASGAKMAGGLGGTLWNVITMNFSKAASSYSKAMSGFGGILKYFNLDKPSDPLTSTRNTLSVVAPFAHMEGVDTSVRLGATPMGGYTDMSFSAAPKEEMSIPHIIQTYMMWNQIAWADTASVGTELANFFVYPGLSHQTIPANAATTTAQDNTFLSYINSMFKYWHGSIKLRFDFTATQFHTGRLLFVFEPNSSTTYLDPATNQTLSGNLTMLFDLHENKTIEFLVPFVSSTPRKECVNQFFNSLATNDLQSLGRISIRVVNALANPDTVTASIPINCYIAAGSDFRFEVPIIDPFLVLPDKVVTQAVEFNSHDALPLRSDDRTCDTFLVKGSNSILNESHFAEDILDVRDLTRRFANLGSRAISITPDVTESAAFAGYTTIPVRPSLNDFTGSLTPVASRSFPDLISRMYTFWSGSMRFKVAPWSSRNQPIISRATFAMNTADNDALFGANPLYSATSGADAGYPILLTNSSQNSALQIECPFYSAYTQLLNNPVLSTGNFTATIYQTGNVFLKFSAPTTDGFPEVEGVPTLYVSVATSCGDDIAFRLLVSPPKTNFYIST